MDLLKVVIGKRKRGGVDDQGTPKKQKVDDLEFSPTDANKKKEEFRNYEDSPRQKTVEHFYRQQHEQQTVARVQAMREKWLQFATIEKSLWEMVELLDAVVDDSDPDTNLSQLDHALQTGESIRKMYPGEEHDWFHLTGFIHDLGKIMAVTDQGLGLEGEPQWSVVGDTFPVGCRHPTEGIVFPQFFEQNPDVKDSRYNTELGMYKNGCGLDKLMMSWGHDEYLYHFCVKYAPKFPKEGLYMIRYHSFYPWHTGKQYGQFTNAEDAAMMEWVLKFNQHDLYSKAAELPDREKAIGYYSAINLSVFIFIQNNATISCLIISFCSYSQCWK